MKKFQKDIGLFPHGGLDFTTQDKLNEAYENLLLKYDRQYVKAIEVLKDKVRNLQNIA